MNELVEKGDMERQHVTGIAHDKNEAKVILTRVPTSPARWRISSNRSPRPASMST